MKGSAFHSVRGRFHRIPAFLFVVILLAVGPPAFGFTLQVVDGNGTPIPVGYRWLVEEDTTHPVTPRVQDNNSLGVNIHNSYAPVAAKGTSADLARLNDPNLIDPSKRYVISVLPDNTYSMGGANIAAGQSVVRVVCQGYPLPTAQISVLVFHDIMPINSAPDAPAEPGLAGFKILLFEQAGQVTVDAFGNNLGSTYVKNPDGSYQLDAEGAPIVEIVGSGIFTNADGLAVMADGTLNIKNLAPGKYGVRAVPPLDNQVWVQTTTLEGTPGIDAWVKPNEAPIFNEAGFFSQHVFIGFVNPVDNASWRPLTTYQPFFPIDNTLYNEQYGTITGQVVKHHSNVATRPLPGLEVPTGNPVIEGWVALTNLNNVDELIYAAPCDNNGNFTIANVPPGTYQLAFWDNRQDVIMAFRSVTVPPATPAPVNPGDPDTGGPTTLALGRVPVPLWFGTLKGIVFNDLNRNGFRDPGETGVANQAVNLRFRDGSVYQSTATNDAGEYEFIEVFPFFKWLVVEVDFATLEATGATVWVDAGGTLPVDRTPPVPVNPLDPNTWYNDVLNPQPQPENGGALYRTEVSTVTAPVLLEGLLHFGGSPYGDQTSVIEWGKANYRPGVNGGITGIVFYATTRAENDPVLGVGEPWEPGIPRVAVNLYADANRDGVIDDANEDGAVTRADADNYPIGNFPGPEDIDRNGNGVFDGGDAINIVSTDSFDDNRPTGCVNPADNTLTPIGPFIECAEIIPMWNQVRPVLFDGGYGFFSYFPGGVDSGNAEVEGLPVGTYIVEVVVPPGYDLVKEEDKNVDFGDEITPATRALETPGPAVPGPVSPALATPNPSTVPPCVGDPHLVPAELALFPGVPSFYAGQTRPLCDRKQIRLDEGMNAAADFFVFTEVPKAGRFVGLVTNDITNTFAPSVGGVPNPRVGSKMAAPWIPIGFQDYQGNEIARVYSDQFGGYNVLLPSTHRINFPAPSGVSPGMVTVVLNSPGPIESPPGSGNFIRDPYFNPGYSVFALTFDLQPGKTTYLDTPVLPIAAFQSNPGLLECEFPDGTPVISQVDGPGGGPYVDRTGRIIRLISVQNISVGGVPRDFGFGDNTGIITVGGVPLNIIAWTDTAVTARVPAGVSTGQLTLTRGDNGRSTAMGITLHVGGRVLRVYPGQKVQDAIDSASPGDIILVTPGVYRENLILWKPLKLQGTGAWSTVIDGSFFSPPIQAAWDAKVQALLDAGEIDHIPGETFNYLLDHGSVITVFADNTPGSPNFFPEADPARIDGLLVTGSVGDGGGGGGILVNAFAHHLQISNNKIQSNQGRVLGGIRLGHQSLVDPAGNTVNGPTYKSAHNDNVNIHHNHIDQNGGVGEPASGGGIGLFNGSDDYRITENRICGNFSLVYGAGISHFGLSDNGLIESNQILFNEAFDEGGGIIIAGELVPAGADPNILSPGTGSVVINRNLIQGNMSADDGAGIRTLTVNGQDVARSPADSAGWYHVDITNNLIVNNVSGDSGGGISLDDTASANIINNTIAHNDATGTFEDAFGALCHPFAQAAGLCTPGGGGGLTRTNPQGSGINVRFHSARLQAAFDPATAQAFPNPVLYNNILWHNRSFYWDGALNGGLGGLFPAADNAFYWDLAVFGGTGSEKLDPRSSILDLNNAANVLNPGENLFSDNTAYPRFADPYFNILETAIGPVGFVTTTFTPLAPTGDYRILGPNPLTDNTASPAIDRGTAPASIPVAGPAGAQTITNLANDIDGEPRPFDEPVVPDNPSAVDIGADEFRRLVLP